MSLFQPSRIVVQIICAVLASTVLLLTAACGGGNTPIPPASGNAPTESIVTLPTGPPVDEPLPGEQFDAAGHVIALNGTDYAPFTAYRKGSYYTQCGAGSTEKIGAAIHLSSGGSAPNPGWAIYRLTMGGTAPGVVCADINLQPRDDQSPAEYWLGLADYRTDCWDWHGPFTEGHLRLALMDDSGDYLSELGNLFACVVVHGGASVDIVGVGATARAGSTAPATPTGLAAQPVSGGIELRWNAADDESVIGYQVYYAKTSFTETTGEGVKRLDHMVTGTGCVLPAAATVYAGITAISTAGVESPLSGAESATPVTGEPARLLLSVSSPVCVVTNEITLTASGCDSYCWDLDGDGIYEVAESNEPTVSLEISDYGVLRPRVRGIAGAGNIAYAGVSSLADYAQWSMYGCDGANTHCSQAVGPDAPNLLWRFRTSGSGDVPNSVELDPDGNIYVGFPGDNTLYKTTPAGTVLWTRQFSKDLHSPTAPTFSPDGNVYLGVDCNLTALSPDGSTIWEFVNDYRIVSPPVYGYGDRIYFIDDGERLVAVNRDGSPGWSIDAHIITYDPPVVSPDGFIYVISYGQILLALNSNGTERWNYTTGNTMTGPLALGSDGTVYLNHYTNRIYAISPAGSVKWFVETSIGALPVIGPDDTIYVANGLTGLLALNPDGTEKWECDEITPSGLACPTADGHVIAAAGPGNLYLLDATGNIVWNTAVTGSLQNRRLRTSNQLILYITQSAVIANSYLHAIDYEGNPLWQLGNGADIDSSPAIATDGTVYFTSSDSNIYALNPEGTNLWSYSKHGQSLSSPAVDNGRIYFCTKNNSSTTYDMLVALDESGNEVWTYPGSSTSSPVVGADGEVYFYLSDRLVVLNRDGSLRWQATSNGSTTAPAVTLAADGTVITSGWVDYAKSLMALNSVGDLLWGTTPEGILTSGSVAIDSAGNGYLRNQSGQLVSVNPDGSLRWQVTTGVAQNSCPAIGPTGDVYLGDLDGICYGLSSTGTELWSVNLGSRISGPVSVDGDGTVYVSTADMLYALNPDGTEKWSAEVPGGNGATPVISADGRIYVGSGDKHLYCFGDE